MNDYEKNKKYFGAKVREYRKKANLTQEKLAEIVDCSWQTISGIETGYASPSTPMLFKLSEALGVPLVYLFDFDKDPEVYANEMKLINKDEIKLINLFRKMNFEKKNLALKLIRVIVSED